MHPVIAIVGPTASGKSDLAIFLAERFSGEIVNYDSVQIFRHLNIGTAKPTVEEQQRVPHHMIDIREPEPTSSLREIISGRRGEFSTNLRIRRKVPILVGGTGLYLRALIEGLFKGRRARLIGGIGWRRLANEKAGRICIGS